MSHDVINFFAWLRSFLCLKQSGYACSAECQQQQWSYLIPLCTYRYVFMPHGMQGSEEPRDQF